MADEGKGYGLGLNEGISPSSGHIKHSRAKTVTIVTASTNTWSLSLT